MRILQIIQRPQLRGAEIFACQLSRELIRLGASVDIAFLYGSSSTDLGFDLNFIPIRGNPQRRFWDFTAYKELANIITEGKYDLIQANASDTLKYSVFSKWLFGWKAPIVFRNASKLTDFIRGPFQKLFNRLVLQGCRYYISVSENCRLDLVTFLPVALKRSVTITIGTYFPDPALTKNEPRESDEPVIINVGSLAPEKNHSFLIDVFHVYFQKYARGYLWIVGDGKLMPQLVEQVAKLSLTDRVKFWGSRKDAVALMGKADVMVMPSKIEGLPGAILEALAVGLPVIASSVGGIPEVITDGVNGFTIENWNKEVYVNRIASIVSDHSITEGFIKRGKDLISSRFQMADIARSFYSVYGNLIQ